MPLFLMKKCELCKKEYTPNKKHQRFCGKSCSLKHSRATFKWTTNKGKSFPELCGDNNPAKRTEVRQKISQALQNRNITWGQKIADSRVTGGYKPSTETRLKQKQSHIKRVLAGLHNNYKGGVTSENERQRKSCEYKMWREFVFKRDNYVCQSCGQRGGDLEADHVMSFAEYPELRLDKLNGQTLCKECHKIKTKKQLTKHL
jgi:hypothetical protein